MAEQERCVDLIIQFLIASAASDKGALHTGSAAKADGGLRSLSLNDLWLCTCPAKHRTVLLSSAAHAKMGNRREVDARTRARPLVSKIANVALMKRRVVRRR